MVETSTVRRVTIPEDAGTAPTMFVKTLSN